LFDLAMPARAGRLPRDTDIIASMNFPCTKL
jgi:hypothetical protein